jgi:torulene dioxygenase
LILDISVYPNHSLLWALTLPNLRQPGKSNRGKLDITEARRYRLRNVSTSSPDTFQQAELVFSTPLSKNIELPTVHPNMCHTRYRYAYGVSKGDPESCISDRLIKLDMDDPRIASEDLADGAAVWGEAYCIPGEPIFVPDPNGTEEDDGVVLSVVLDGKMGKSMLIVLNAKNMEEFGRAVMNHPFPFGFHGAFVKTI